jgi:ubiquinone/menaquinone biosynthesis C-methylase UbiE
MTDSNAATEEAEFWNNEGGKMWTSNMDRTHQLLAPLSKRLLASAAVSTGEIVLDVGCGGGETTRQIAESVGSTGRVVGVDVSEMILAKAKQQGRIPENLSFELQDAATADLGEAVYDLIFSRFGIMFFEDPKAAFKNIRRALKTSGRLTGLCWRTPPENPWISRPVRAAAEILAPGDQEKPDPRAPGPFAFADPDWVREILDAAGFSNINLEPMEQTMALGKMDEAVAYMMRMGPSAAEIAAAPEEKRKAVADAISAAFAEFNGPGGVMGPCATWIITADA